MSLVSALSKLLVKMGGTPENGDNSDELIDKIANAYSGALIVNFSIYNPESDQVTKANTNVPRLKTDKTAGEIFAALPNVIPLAANPSGSGNQIWRIIAYNFDEESGIYSIDINAGVSNATLYATEANSIMISQ